MAVGAGERRSVAELATGATVAAGAGEAAFGLAGDGAAPAFGMLTKFSPTCSAGAYRTWNDESTDGGTGVGDCADSDTAEKTTNTIINRAELFIRRIMVGQPGA